MDTETHELDEGQIVFLQTLARQVIKLLDQKQLNKQLQHQREKLEQQMELQNRILSIIAHDVRNPVGAVKSIIELSGKKLLSKQDRQLLPTDPRFLHPSAILTNGPNYELTRCQ